MKELALAVVPTVFGKIDDKAQPHSSLQLLLMVVAHVGDVMLCLFVLSETIANSKSDLTANSNFV